MASTREPHLLSTYSDWADLNHVLSSAKLPGVSVNGQHLSIAEVVAVALHGITPNLTEDEDTLKRVSDSVQCLEKQLSSGATVYGVNTGFGGSADTRTPDFALLQSALVQLQNVGILLPSDKTGTTDGDPKQSQLLRSHALPVPIVRAMMLIRCNSLMRGHSGVRLNIIRHITKLLSLNMTPVVPIRGSISASGDLSTLSYIAGAVEGNPDVFIRNDGLPGGPQILASNEALAVAKMSPIRLQAKEGLGITNGTAASCATACLVVYQANQLAVLVQLLTAMGTEALAGTAGNYDSFVSSVRPHSGQLEAARNIRKFLAGSKISPDETSSQVGLAQDRYSLRTAPQWIGPQLEDLLLATKQVTVEINSTTDNPLIDVDGGKIFQGGNFQAMAITSAMEKVMTVLQNLGRLMFAQSSEMINHATSRGLPPNLSPDDPSASFLCKGFDISMAAYMSELGYLAHPVSTHVQTAEMANQAVNSMALVAARYALEAIEVASLMAAAYIFILCQALDLRCMILEFEASFTKEISLVAEDTLMLSQEQAARISGEIATVLLRRWTQLCTLDAAERATIAARESLGDLLMLLLPSNPAPDVSRLEAFQAAAASTLLSTHVHTRSQYFERPGTTQFISPAAKVVYEFVRRDLAVPFVRGVEDHPTVARDRELRNSSGDKTNVIHGREKLGSTPAADVGEVTNGTLHEETAKGTNEVNGLNRVNEGKGSSQVNGNNETNGSRWERRTPVTLGTMAGDIYQALRNGELHGRIMKHCQKSDF